MEDLVQARLGFQLCFNPGWCTEVYRKQEINTQDEDG